MPGRLPLLAAPDPCQARRRRPFNGLAARRPEAAQEACRAVNRVLNAELAAARP